MSVVHEAEQRFVHRPPGRSAHARSARPPAGAAPVRVWEYDALLSVSLAVDDEDDRQTAILNIRGELDLATAPVLLEALLAAIESSSGSVVMDLSEVRFMDVTGVHVLLDTHRRLRSRQRRLAIACREHGQVHRLLALTGLLDALTVHRSGESAVVDCDEPIRAEPSTPDDAHRG